MLNEIIFIYNIFPSLVVIGSPVQKCKLLALAYWWVWVEKMFLCGSCNCRYISKMAAEACCNGKGGIKPVMSVNFLEFTKEKKHKLDVEEEQ